MGRFPVQGLNEQLDLPGSPFALLMQSIVEVDTQFVLLASLLFQIDSLGATNGLHHQPENYFEFPNLRATCILVKKVFISHDPVNFDFPVIWNALLFIRCG